ncbi:MAG: hypothetical protein PHQ43_09065 [Dehalococcoidales bacterium]|nr:hypothetical protein [Dehalococcoidales bacterium]
MLPAPIARAMTKEEAEDKARRYIKPGHRVVKKQHGTYQGKEYNYVVYVK